MPRLCSSERAAPHVVALGLYTLLAVIVTWPILPSFRTGVVGEVGGVDAYQNAWNLWWTARALASGRSPFWTPLLYYPNGVDLFWQTLGFSQGVAALPITLTLGPLAAVNWTILTSFMFGGYFTWLFARYVLSGVRSQESGVRSQESEGRRASTLSHPSSVVCLQPSIVHRPSPIVNGAALVAGAVYAFSPFHLEKVIDGNIEVAAIHWIPLYAFALHLLLQRPAIWRALLSGALLLWVSLGSWYYGTFCVLYTGCAVVVWCVCFAADERRMTTDGRRRTTPPLPAGWAGRSKGGVIIPRPSSIILRPLLGLVPLLIWGLVLAPRIAGLTQAGNALQDMRSVQVERSADLVDFFLPSPTNPWWGPAVRAARAEVYPNAVIWNVALGSVALVLGALGAVTRWRVAWPWLALLAATMLLAMGPVLRVAGYNTGIPLPFALLQDLPGIRSGQRPNHMAVLASLMLALLATYGVAWLQQRLAKTRRQGDKRTRRQSSVVHPFGFAQGRRPSSAVSWLLALVLVLAVIVIDGNAGLLRIVGRPVHPWYATLPQPDGALMPLPLYVNINRSENLTTQMVHGWPILGGYVARPPDYDLARYTPGIRELQYGTVEPNDIVSPGWPESGQRALAAYRVRYITLDLTSDKDKYFAQVRQRLQELAVGPPLVADATLEAYAVPREWPVAPLVFLASGWQPLERQPGANERWRWMGDTAELRLYNPYDAPVLATLTLTMASYQPQTELHFALDGAQLGQRDVPPELATQRIALLLRPGEHSLMLQADATPDPGRNGAPISVRVFAVVAEFSALPK